MPVDTCVSGNATEGRAGGEGVPSVGSVRRCSTTNTVFCFVRPPPLVRRRWDAWHARYLFNDAALTTDMAPKDFMQWQEAETCLRAGFKRLAAGFSPQRLGFNPGWRVVDEMALELISLSPLLTTATCQCITAPRGVRQPWPSSPLSYPRSQVSGCISHPVGLLGASISISLQWLRKIRKVSVTGCQHTSLFDRNMATLHRFVKVNEINVDYFRISVQTCDGWNMPVRLSSCWNTVSLNGNLGTVTFTRWQWERSASWHCILSTSRSY
jgi:hypothetical protein